MFPLCISFICSLTHSFFHQFNSHSFIAQLQIKSRPPHCSQSDPFQSQSLTVPSLGTVVPITLGKDGGPLLALAYSTPLCTHHPTLLCAPPTRGSLSSSDSWYAHLAATSHLLPHLEPSSPSPPPAFTDAYKSHHRLSESVPLYFLGLFLGLLGADDLPPHRLLLEASSFLSLL